MIFVHGGVVDIKGEAEEILVEYTQVSAAFRTLLIEDGIPKENVDKAMEKMIEAAINLSDDELVGKIDKIDLDEMKGETQDGTNS